MNITKPGIYPDCPNAEYHKDPCEFVSLSSSIAKKMVAESARHAWTAHPKLGAKKEEGEEETPDPKATKAREKGTLIHRLLLGKGGDIVVCPFDNWRKDAAKEQRDTAKANGQIPTLPHLLAEAQAAANAGRQQLDDMGYDYVFRHGLKEAVIVWTDGEIWLRAMIDTCIIDEDSKTAEIWDLKSTGKSAHPEACANQIDKLSYDLSMEFYLRGLVALRPELAGRVKKRWAFIETEPPYAVTPVEISAEWEMAAEMKCSRAIAKWRQCMKENKWPFFVDKLTRLEPKPWVIGELLANQDE